MSRHKSWFSMAKKTNDLAEIEIFSEIDPFWGIGPNEFKTRLDEIKDAKNIKLLLNSPGGSVFDGMAIYNLLVPLKDKLDVEVVGLAASIASIVALAGKKLTIAKGAYLMIHNPYTLTVGGAEDLRKTADLLDTMKNEFIGIYKGKSNLSDNEISQMMDDETWLTSSQAIEKGFADAEEDYSEIAAKASSVICAGYGFTHVPETLQSNQRRMTPRDLENILRDAGFSKRESVAMASCGFKALKGDLAEPEGEPSNEPQVTPEQLRIRANALLESAGITL